MLLSSGKTQRRYTAQPRKKRRGAYVVEMSIALPILFLVIMGGLELFQLSRVRHACNQAVYEAARRLVIPGGSRQEAVDAAKHVIEANGFRLGSITVSPEVISMSTQEVTVELSVRFRSEWSFARIVGVQDIHARCTLAHEYSLMNHP